MSFVILLMISRSIIRLLLIGVVTSLICACGPSVKDKQATADKEAQAERLKKTLAATRLYFGNEVKGSWGTWSVTSIEPDEPNPFLQKANGVIVKIAVPPDQAREIIGRDTLAQYRAIGRNACPRKSDALWQSFGSEDRLTLNPTISGTVFADVDCREHGLP